MSLTKSNIRRQRPTAIVHSGQLQTVFNCVCGATHTTSSRHRDVRHVIDWRELHDTKCLPIYKKIKGLI